LDIAKGVHYLHSHNIMHLDLKSPNILLAADYSAKIADVGLSCIFTAQSLPVAMVSTPANCYLVTSEHTARCPGYCDAWLCCQHVFAPSCCVSLQACVATDLQMHRSPAVLMRMHSIDRAHHVHVGLYSALEQLGVARHSQRRDNI